MFGGPAWYSQQFGGAAGPWQVLAGHGFAEEQRARWVALATRAADEARLPADPEFRAALTGYLEWASRLTLTESTGAAARTEAEAAGNADAEEPVPSWDWGPAGPPNMAGARWLSQTSRPSHCLGRG